MRAVKKGDPPKKPENISGYQGFTTDGDQLKEWNITGDSAKEVMSVARAQHKAFIDKGYKGQPTYDMVSLKDPKTKKSFFRVYTKYEGKPKGFGS